MKRLLLAVVGLVVWAGSFAATEPFKTYVNGLSAASALGGTELIACIQGGNDVACTPNQIQTFLAIPTAANPSGTVGLSAVNGSAATFMRSDGAPALSQSIVPTWTGIHTFSATPVFNAGVTIGGINSNALAQLIINGTPACTNTTQCEAIYLNAVADPPTGAGAAWNSNGLLSNQQYNGNANYVAGTTLNDISSRHTFNSNYITNGGTYPAWVTDFNPEWITDNTTGMQFSYFQEYGSTTAACNNGITGNPITTLGAITAGSSYTNGTYNGVALTGGSGSAAKANITVAGGAVTAVTLVNTGATGSGYNYVVGDTLSATAASIGGTGSGFSIPVNATITLSCGMAVLAPFTGAAGVNGVLANLGLALTVSTGSSAGTTNYGIKISGNGGTSGATNWALWSNSTADSKLPGGLDSTPVGLITPAAGAFTTLTATTPVAVTSGGSGIATATLGDLRYGSGTNTMSSLAGNTTATKNFLTQTGNGTVSAAPAWGTLAAGDIPNLAASILTSGTVAVARGGTNLASYTTGDILYASGATTLASLADVATGQVLHSGGVATAPAYSAIASSDLTTALASPPAIGGTAAAAVHATALTSVPAAAPTRDAGNVCYVLVQSALPMILQSSGSIGNNGALTGLTSIANTYASAYMWFPTNTISASTPAGWYYVVMSSGTAATIYNNTYTSGTPVIPASPTAFVTTGPGAYTQSTSVQTPITISLPGNTLGVNGSLELDALTSQNNTAGTKSLSPKYGGSALGALAATTQITTNGLWRMRNAGATNVQLVSELISGATVATIVTAAPGRLAIDTTAAQNVTINLTLNTATDYQVLESYSAKVCPN